MNKIEIPFRNVDNMKVSLIFILSLFSAQIVRSQDIHFSQFNETNLLLNPGSAGVGHDVNVVLNYRNQWQSMGQGYNTLAASGDMKLLKSKKTNLGLGLSFFNDKAGDSKMGTTLGNLSLAGIIHLNKISVLSTGLMLGFSQRTVDANNLKFGSQYDGESYNPNLSSGEMNIGRSNTTFDVGAGIVYSYGSESNNSFMNDIRKVKIGFAIFHPNSPNVSYYTGNSTKSDMKMVFHGNGSFGVPNSNIVIQPSYMFLMQGKLKELTFGSSFQFQLQESSRVTGFKKSSALSFGAYYRFKDALIGLVKYEFSNYSVGLSYDVNISKLSVASKARGGFEVSLRFYTPSMFGKGKNRSRI